MVIKACIPRKVIFRGVTGLRMLFQVGFWILHRRKKAHILNFVIRFLLFSWEVFLKTDRDKEKICFLKKNTMLKKTRKEHIRTF